MVAGGTDPAEDVAQFGVVVEQAQQGFAARPPLAHTEYVFGRRIQADDEPVPVEQDDTGTQTVEDMTRLLVTAVVD
jgi:hypothetical protein